jgi:Dolichyl-phosphate-mannose-protein mannosyltransferase
MHEVKRPWKLGLIQVLLPAWACLAAGTALDLELPGLYMDVVNPDFAAVMMIGAPYVPVILPGNTLFGRLPVLPALYHGSLHAWIGAPVFAIFGTSMEVLRALHAAYAAAVLAALGGFLLYCGIGRLTVAAVLAGLAIDPSFLFSFRTQNYITTFPAVFLFASIVMLDRSVSAEHPKSDLFWSGVLAGVAVYGYFVYAFFLPPLLLAIVLIHDVSMPLKRAKLVMRWCVGIALGCLFYWIGYGLTAVATVPQGGIVNFINHAGAQLGVFGSKHGFVDRLGLLDYFFPRLPKYGGTPRGCSAIEFGCRWAR